MAKDKIYYDKFTDYATYLDVGEYRIPLPKKPADKDIINYGLPVEKQKFQKTKYKVNGHEVFAYELTKKIWKTLPKSQQQEIENKEWYCRINGQWQFIKGRSIWIPPNMYFFLNYWLFQDNTRPEFWDSQCASMTLSNWAFHHPLILGRNKVKGRRGGGTAEENNNNLHYCTLYKGSNGGMMNKNKDEAIKINFNPIVHALVNLPEFFQPKRSGEQRPKNEIVFSPPSARLTQKSAKEDRDDYDNNGYLNSYMNFLATSEIGYDGNTMTFIEIDELFKWKNISPVKAIEIQSECIKKGGVKNHTKDEFGHILYYKGLMSNLSSVEEISDEQLDLVRLVWDSSDPKTGTTNSISASNCIRYFEPFYFGLNGYIDEWGFSDTERAIKEYREQEEEIRRTKGNKAAIDFRRKFPETLEHALLPSATRCVFDVAILNQARDNYYNLLPDEVKPVRGMLYWIKKFETVGWKPMPNEKENSLAPFICSGLPNDQHRNNTVLNYQNRYPANRGIYSGAVDPIEYDKKETSEGSKLSNGSFRIKREYDHAIDGDKFDDEGHPINHGYGFETNRTVMTFCYRPESAEKFYEYVAMACIFYGCPILMEATSKSMKKYFIENGLAYFLVDKDGKQINRDNMETIGWKASEQAKKHQFEVTENYVANYGLAERHIECIDELLIITLENLTHHDLGAAFTISEVLSSLQKKRFEKPVQQQEKKIQIKRRIISPGKTLARWQ